MFNKCNTTFELDRFLIPFLQDSPFFAEFSRHIYKAATEDIPTAAVAFDPTQEQLSMFYNPKFFEVQTPKAIKGTIEHEFLHPILGHLQFRRRDPFKLWNVATDLAINSIITTKGENKSSMLNADVSVLPVGCLIPGKWPVAPEGRAWTPEEKEAMPLAAIIADLPLMKSSEWYYDEIIKQAHKMQKEGKLPSKGSGTGVSVPGLGGGDPSDTDGEKSSSNDDVIDELFKGSGIDSIDDHSFWDNIPEDQREFVASKIRNILEKAVQEADKHSEGWGNIPMDLRNDIRKSISNIVNWRNVLRQFVGSITRGSRKTSIKRINKRYPYIHPGLKRGYVAKLLIAIDMSGSVDNKMLEMFFAELGSLTKKVEIDILPFDCKANKKDIYTWRKGQSMPAKRTKMGGTDFNAPTDVLNDPANRGRWDGMLIMTDGECCAPRTSRIKRGWVLGQNRKLLFPTQELVIALDDGKNTQASGPIR